jgi:hypothetical protein
MEHSQHLITINNEKIWKFFKERHPTLHVEDCMLLFIDLIETLPSTSISIQLFKEIKKGIEITDVNMIVNSIQRLIHLIREKFQIGVPQDAQEAFLYLADLLCIDTSIKLNEQFLEEIKSISYINSWYKFQNYTKSIIYDTVYTQFHFKTSDKEDRYEPLLSFQMIYQDNFKNSFDMMFEGKDITILSPIVSIYIVNCKEVPAIEVLDNFELSSINDHKNIKQEYYFNSCIFKGHDGKILLITRAGVQTVLLKQVIPVLLI